MNLIRGLLTIVIFSSACAKTSDEETLYLSIYVNHVKKIDLVEVVRNSNKFNIEKKWISKLDISTFKNIPGHSINICGVEKIRCVYDKQKQTLLLMADVELLPTYNLEREIINHKTIIKTRGLLVNYNASFTKFNGIPAGLDLLQQWRLFTENGSFETTGNYHDTLGTTPNRLNNGVTRYDTHFTRYDEQKSQVIRVGDFVSSGNTWSRQYRMGGLRIAKDYSLQPDFITYPYPEFSGSSVLPSTVELFINGSRQYIDAVAPGNFNINYAPTVSGLSNATIQTRDARGRYTEQTLQFYLSTELLKPGLSSYDFNVGSLRQQYGTRSFEYDSSIATVGNFRYGLSRRVTGSVHYELTGGMRNVGVGMDLVIDSLGILSPSIAYGENSRHGGALSSLAYRYQTRRWGLSARWLKRNKKYQDIGSINDVRFSQRETQVSTAYSFDEGTALSFNYVNYKMFNDPSAELISFGFSKSKAQASFNASLSYALDQDETWAFNASFSMPFGIRSRGSIRAFEASNARSQSYLNYNTSSEKPNFWNVSGLLSLSQTNYAVRGNIKTNGNEFTLSGYKRDGNEGYFADVSGSFVLYQKNLYSGRRIADTFAIVSTGGIKDVPVYVENQRLGSTDSNGTFLITGVPAYNSMRVSIGTEGLPLNSQVTQPEQLFSGAKGNAAFIKFDIQNKLSAVVILTDSTGIPLKLGTQVSLNDGDFFSSVGWDGEVYLEKVKSKNTLTVRAEGKGCEVTFETSVSSEQIPRVGPIVCNLEKL